MKRSKAASAGDPVNVWRSSTISKVFFEPADSSAAAASSTLVHPRGRWASVDGEGSLEARDQPRLAAVGALGPVPGHGMVGHRGPACDERGLPGSGGGDHERQPMDPQLGQELVEALPGEPTDPGRTDLRRDDRATGVTVRRRTPFGPRSHPMTGDAGPPSQPVTCRCETPLLYTSPSPRDGLLSR